MTETNRSTRCEHITVSGFARSSTERLLIVKEMWFIGQHGRIIVSYRRQGKGRIWCTTHEKCVEFNARSLSYKVTHCQ